MKRELPSFSAAQKAAVEHGEGPLMVLAGPGSGKTFVIVHRICYLTEVAGIAPSRILVLTFSRKAAREMQERFLILAQERGYGGGASPVFGTFHSFFFSILRTAYGYRKNQIVTEEEKYGLLKKILKKRLPEGSVTFSVITRTLTEIALEKQNRGLSERTKKSKENQEIFSAYERELANLNKIDFEDMLWMTEELLAERVDIREALQERYRYILVDEFQDINFLQYTILKKLTGFRKNLTIVGDDDQSVYRFRGAQPEIMLGFEKDFPNCRRVILDINFRSTKEIVEASSRLISHNKRRFSKRMLSHRGIGKPVDIIGFSDTVEEAKGICTAVRSYKNRGFSYSDVAVLFRTNRQPVLLSSFFSEMGIPYFLGDELPSFFTHRIVKDVLAYFRLASKREDTKSLWRIANRPPRFIHREALARGGGFQGLIDYYPEMSYSKRRVQQFLHHIEAMEKMTPGEGIRFLRKEVGYDDFIQDVRSSFDIDPEEGMSILEDLEGLASLHENYASFFSFVEKFEKNSDFPRLRQGNGNSRGEREKNPGVQLLTFHGAKGLEFPVVFILDVNEGICPYKKANSKEEMEEERRCLYVAMTRAKECLHICTCKKHFFRERKASVFLQEIIHR